MPAQTRLTTEQRIQNFMRKSKKIEFTAEEIRDGLNSQRDLSKKVTSQHVRTAMRGSGLFIATSHRPSDKMGRNPQQWGLKSVIDKMTAPGKVVQSGAASEDELNSTSTAVEENESGNKFTDNDPVRVVSDLVVHQGHTPEVQHNEVNEVGGIMVQTSKFELDMKKLDTGISNMGSAIKQLMGDLESLGESGKVEYDLVQQVLSRVNDLTRIVTNDIQVGSNTNNGDDRFEAGYEKGFTAGLKFAEKKNRELLDKFNQKRQRDAHDFS